MPAPPASTASGALGPLHNKTRGFCPPKGSRTPLPPTAQPQAPALPTQEDKDLRGLACLSWPHTSSSSAIPSARPPGPLPSPFPLSGRLFLPPCLPAGLVISSSSGSALCCPVLEGAPPCLHVRLALYTALVKKMCGMICVVAGSSVRLYVVEDCVHFYPLLSP